MKYLGIEVHVKTSVWCLLDKSGQILKRGKVATTALDLTALLRRMPWSPHRRWARCPTSCTMFALQLG
jgi:hypothetical protein